MLIDPEKLAEVREVVDFAVVEEHLRTGEPRWWVRVGLAEQLGFQLETEDVEGWHIATAVHDDEEEMIWELARHDGVAAAVKFGHAVRRRRECQAANAEDAETAVLCLLLDPSVDVWMTPDRCSTFYPANPEAAPFTYMNFVETFAEDLAALSDQDFADLQTELDKVSKKTGGQRGNGGGGRRGE